MTVDKSKGETPKAQMHPFGEKSAKKNTAPPPSAVVEEATLSVEKACRAAILEIRLKRQLPHLQKPVCFSPSFAESSLERIALSYQTQALHQASVQFGIGIAAEIIGFLWIIIAITKFDPGNIATAANVLPGIIISAISQLFFAQMEKTRLRATELYDRLREDDRLTKAASVADSIDNAKVRSQVQAKLTLHMAETALLKKCSPRRK